MNLEIRRLNELDFKSVSELVIANKPRQPGYDYERGLYWIQHSYLNSEVSEQFMLGGFIQNELKFIYSARLGFPEEGKACVGNAFADPSMNCYGIAKEVIREMFRLLRSYRCHLFYSAVKFRSAQKQELLIPEGYSTSPFEVVKAGAQSRHDFVNSLLGRRAHDEDMLIREISCSNT